MFYDNDDAVNTNGSLDVTESSERFYNFKYLQKASLRLVREEDSGMTNKAAESVV